MAVKLKPKSFGPVFVLYDSTDTLRYAYGDPSEATEYPPVNSPVDTLLASLASCIAKSIEITAASQKASLRPFTVQVDGAKSTDLPGRLAKAHITVIGDFVDDEEQLQKIVKQAKAICTVSNSLTTEITIETTPDV
ncbi:OsmC family protein [Falsihalocynthiibacter sp. SS001]|uniref:OsmC family protein n=1 Tax=Falsihalocynthiibacter sp. SS001 TaxID=3349698 RepID=UPI0036D35402